MRDICLFLPLINTEVVSITYCCMHEEADHTLTSTLREYCGFEVNGISLMSERRKRSIISP